MPIIRHIFAIISKQLNNLMFEDEDNIKCKKCKGKMILQQKRLYLLPCYFGDTHEESAAYYINNLALIDNLEQIPTGRRAAYVSLFSCGSCTNKTVSVVDFLKVREKTVAKGGSMFSYDEMKNIL